MARVYYDGYNGREGVILPMPCRSECEKGNDCGCEKNDICECKNTEQNECALQNDECAPQNTSCQKNSLFGFDSFLPSLQLDDIILLGIVLVMLHDGTDDKLLLVIIGIVFLLGFDSPAVI